jgi:hypothetical protein
MLVPVPGRLGGGGLKYIRSKLQYALEIAMNLSSKLQYALEINSNLQRILQL